MDLKFLELLRLLELEKVLSILSKINKEKVGQIRILEIGGGAGWQARALAEAGYSVESIDVNNTSNYFKDKVYSILQLFTQE